MLEKGGNHLPLFFRELHTAGNRGIRFPVFYARFAFPRLYSGRKYRRKVGESQAMQAGRSLTSPKSPDSSIKMLNSFIRISPG